MNKNFPNFPNLTPPPAVPGLPLHPPVLLALGNIHVGLAGHRVHILRGLLWRRVPSAQVREAYQAVIGRGVTKQQQQQPPCYPKWHSVSAFSGSQFLW